MALDSSPLERVMKVLAIDTAGWECSVALWEDGKEIVFHQKPAERDQATILPLMTGEILKDEKIDQVLVNVGPGSFTGIRVGLAFAKGLAKGLEIPLKGFDNFMSTYLSLPPLEEDKEVLILLDARRTDVYAKKFFNGTTLPPQLLTRKDVEVLLSAPSSPLLTGSGLYPLLEGLDFEEIKTVWKGAQRLAHGFFTYPDLTVAPFPFYVKNADVTYLHQ